MTSSSVESKSIHHFENISELTKFIFASEDAREMYSRLTKGVCLHSDWDISSIQVLDQDVGKAIPLVRYDCDFDASKTDFSGWNTDISPVGKVLEDGEPLVLLDAMNQLEFPGYRDDAKVRGYHTVVVVPLDVRDENRRQMVYSVASRTILSPTDDDIAFLKCVAELSTIAIRKTRDIEKEQRDAVRLRQIVNHITSSLSRTLDAEAAGTLASALSGLFPAGWLAIDLTSGKALYDHDNPPPVELVHDRCIPDELITAALNSKDSLVGDLVNLQLEKSDVPVMISALRIDDSHVGALFFFNCAEPTDNEKIAWQAGQLALSSFILRKFIEFKSRKASSRRLLMRLFSRNWDKLDEILDEAHQLDFDLTKSTRVMLLETNDSGPLDDPTHSFVLRTTQLTLGPAISCVIDGRLAILISDSDARIGEKEKFDFQVRIDAYLSRTPLIVLSDLFGSYRDIAQGFEFCTNTLNVGRSMKKSGWISSKTVGEFAALMATADATKIDQFLGNVIRPILAMSEQKSRTAIQTIEVFLASGRRYQDTADSLEIHVSTLRYRLDQIENRAGINFMDPDECFELALAIKLLKHQKSYES